MFLLKRNIDTKRELRISLSNKQLNEINYMKENEINSCQHCGSRLPKSHNSPLCKKCRFKGHREFGDCVKCNESRMELNKNSKLLAA